jgi:hypothetical protein
VREGDIDGLILQDPYRMGFLGTWTMVQDLEHRDVGPRGSFRSTGEYVITRDEHDPAHRDPTGRAAPLYAVDSAETRALYDPEAQAARRTEDLLRP